MLKSFELSIGLTSVTAIFDVTGHSALSLPIGWSRAVDDDSVLLPVGLQVVGGVWQGREDLARLESAGT